MFRDTVNINLHVVFARAFSGMALDHGVTGVNNQIIILVGYPGSGKSTYARTFEQQGWCVVNQDLLGSRSDCLSMMREALVQGKNVVVDRTNISRKQRRHFIDCARNNGFGNVVCHVMQCHPKLCVKRIHRRKGHPTIDKSMSLAKKREIVNKFISSYEAPREEEGFNEIKYISAPKLNLKNIFDKLTRKCKYVFTRSNNEEN